MSNEILKSYVDRLVQLAKEKKELAELNADVKAEAKSKGYDVAALDKIVSRIMAKEDSRKRQKACDEIALVYAEALGQLSLFS
jgi:uncharacterized protein (UPF0335 family)